MALPRPALFVVATAVAGVALLACAAPRPGAPVAGAAASASASADDPLSAHIGDAACSAPTDCHTVAIGHKACGGPETWRAWSSKRSDANQINELAARDAARRQAAQPKGGVASTCSLVTDPGATCDAGRCVLRSERQVN